MTKDKINKAIQKLRQLIIDQELSDFHELGGVADMCERLIELKSLLQSDNEGMEVLNVKYRYPPYAVKYADGNCPNCNNVVFSDKNSDICTKCGTKLKWPENQKKGEV